VEHARLARDDDLARILDLARELREELAEYRGGALWRLRDAVPEPLAVTFAEARSRPDARLVVGTLDDVVVGYGMVEFEALPDGSRLAEVRELYVEPPARAVGTGEAITDLLVTECHRAGCRAIDVIALPGHRATKNFFEDQGFTARALVMHRDLEPGGAGRAVKPRTP
jgi:ribosomal protein S18 acetylase RimI-like enzyme